MRASYGIVESRAVTTTLYVIIILYVAMLAYFVISGEWMHVAVFSLNLIVFVLLIRKRNTQYIQISENDRLVLGTHAIDIRAIDHLRFYDTCTFRVHYSLEGNPRISVKMRLREADKADLLMVLKEINPNIQIN